MRIFRIFAVVMVLTGSLSFTAQADVPNHRYFGGFAGLNAAKALGRSKFDVWVVDKTNHHLFQPLLYQVASAALSPGDIAVPIREILSPYDNITVLMGEVVSIDKEAHVVQRHEPALLVVSQKDLVVRAQHLALRQVGPAAG